LQLRHNNSIFVNLGKLALDKSNDFKFSQFWNINPIFSRAGAFQLFPKLTVSKAVQPIQKPYKVDRTEKSNWDISIDFNLLQFSNVFCICISLLESLLPKVTCSKEVHPENINIILCTREKLRLDKSIDINWVHALNIQLIFVTKEVSKFRKWISLILVESENIDSQSFNPSLKVRIIVLSVCCKLYVDVIWPASTPFIFTFESVLTFPGLITWHSPVL